MLFVLISLAATALIGTPVLARVIKNTIRESEEYKGKKREETSSNKGEAVDDEMIDLISSGLLLENEPNLHSNEFNDVISYENSLVSIRWNESHSQTHKPPPAPKPKKEPVQSTSSAPIKPTPVTSPASPPPLKPMVDKVELNRSTPSADVLFDDSARDISSMRAFGGSSSPSVSHSSPKSMIRAEPSQKNKKTKSKPARKRLITPLGEVEQHLIHSEKKKVREVSSKQDRPSPIRKLLITEAPSARPQKDHFEVIQPLKQSKQNIRRESFGDLPEQRIQKDEAQRGFQPLYVDFTPFFSLDALMWMEDSNMFSAFHKTKRKSKSKILDETPTVDSPTDESEEDIAALPEWQFLLGQVNDFLFNMKLERQHLPQSLIGSQNLEGEVASSLSQSVRQVNAQHLKTKNSLSKKEESASHNTQANPTFNTTPTFGVTQKLKTLSSSERDAIHQGVR